MGILRLLNSVDQPHRWCHRHQTDQKTRRRKNHIKVYLFLKKHSDYWRSIKRLRGKRQKLFKLSFIAFKISNRTVQVASATPASSPFFIAIVITTSKAKQNIVFITIHLQAIVWNVRLVSETFLLTLPGKWFDLKTYEKCYRNQFYSISKHTRSHSRTSIRYTDAQAKFILCNI